MTVSELLRRQLISTISLDERNERNSPNDFINFLGMDKGTYEELLNLVGPKIQKPDTRMSNAISPNQRLSITFSCYRQIPFLI